MMQGRVKSRGEMKKEISLNGEFPIQMQRGCLHLHTCVYLTSKLKNNLEPKHQTPKQIAPPAPTNLPRPTEHHQILRARSLFNIISSSFIIFTQGGSDTSASDDAHPLCRVGDPTNGAVRPYHKTGPFATESLRFFSLMAYTLLTFEKPLVDQGGFESPIPGFQEVSLCRCRTALEDGHHQAIVRT
jgi:hypothetical protein